MADDDHLSRPLLSPPPPSDQHLILTVRDDDDPPANRRRPSSAQNRRGNHNHAGRERDAHCDSHRNPFAFLGSDWFKVPEMTTIDPFRNRTRKIEGVYEWLKIVICLPIALVRLVLFGASLSVGYIATRLALEGWKDRDNPMPKWRCWIMWITRFCARCILFSFGSVSSDSGFRLVYGLYLIFGFLKFSFFKKIFRRKVKFIVGDFKFRLCQSPNSFGGYLSSCIR